MCPSSRKDYLVTKPWEFSFWIFEPYIKLHCFKVNAYFSHQELLWHWPQEAYGDLKKFAFYYSWLLTIEISRVFMLVNGAMTLPLRMDILFSKAIWWISALQGSLDDHSTSSTTAISLKEMCTVQGHDSITLLSYTVHISGSIWMTGSPTLITWSIPQTCYLATESKAARAKSVRSSKAVWQEAIIAFLGL